jgi:hypothetical protein
LEIADCRLPIADCRLPIADCRLPIADCDSDKSAIINRQSTINPQSAVAKSSILDSVDAAR